MQIKNAPIHHPWKKGKNIGVTFIFKEVGDGLHLHSHPEGEAHFTFVRKGRVAIIREDGSQEVVGPGTWKIFEPNEIHGYVALDAGAKITNIIY